MIFDIRLNCERVGPNPLNLQPLGSLDVKQVSVLMAFLLAACSYGPEPDAKAAGSDVGSTGNIQYKHDQLTARKHLLTVTAAPGLMETESSIFQRTQQFAFRFAASTCPAEFDFVDDPNMIQPTAAGFMQRTRTYVFVCN